MIAEQLADLQQRFRELEPRLADIQGEWAKLSSSITLEEFLEKVRSDYRLPEWALVALRFRILGPGNAEQLAARAAWTQPRPATF